MALCDMNEPSIIVITIASGPKPENRVVAFTFCAAKVQRSTNH